ncbi:C-C motif chemokine 4-like [Centroberyx gerrardi]|uniref:C-C motif chemokine 4-like n=1 Tax=Centroberyx gerrardi TaxID=166262 RepID=UPI003AABEE90
MTMMMKNPVILVVCTLLFSTLAVLASQSSFAPDECCFRFAPGRLPKNNVLSYHHTHSQCAMNGVLFQMKTGVKICADPTQRWVQNIIKTVNSRPKAQTAKAEGSGSH